MQRLQFDPEKWAELNRLLDVALDLPPEQRGRWIEGLDHTLEGYKPQLRELLSRAAEVETRDFLATLPKLAAPASEEAGRTIGPYRLIRELGFGGMGSVWLAERTDGLIKRPIALKLPHLLSGRAGLGERMAREREILAALTHPHIARLYDAGVSPEGRPYLALECVDGLPIDRYASEHKLGVRARLELFLQAANAVAYAHAKLIIHRDLKPANMLVTAEGEVRLLDFGIAKLLDEGRADATQLTELSGRALTPDYASPEQIRGESLTIASDVYSLGVVLYELLTGVRPYRLKRSSRGALEDAILQAEPMRPSEAAPPELRRQLRGDLDTILLKALKKSPRERYDTVNALALDVQRYLERRPVMARPDRAFYRFSRFIARHRFAAAATCAVALALSSGAALALWQARQALVQKERAEEVRQFIVSMFQDANPYNVEDGALGATELLKQAAAKIENIDVSRAELRVELLNLIGSALLGLQETDTAEQVVMQAVAEAQERLAPEHPAAIESRAQLITVHRYRGRTAQMQAELDRLLPQLRRLSEADPQPLINALRDAAHVGIDSGRYEEAVGYAREAADLSLARLGELHVQAASSWQVFALSLVYAKQNEEALRAAERAHAMTLAVRGGDERHPQVINSRSTYARALAESHQLLEGVHQLERAIADSAAVFGEDNRMVGFFSQNLVRYQLDAGLVSAAVLSAERAVRILGRHAAPDSFTYGAALSARGAAFLSVRRAAEALRDLEAARAVSVTMMGEDHPVAVRMEAMQAVALAYLGRNNDARARVHDAASRRVILENTDGSAAYWLGLAARLVTEHELAIRLQRQAIALADASPRGARQKMEALAETGLTHLALRDYPAALDSLERAAAMFVEHHGAMSPAQADVLLGLGRAHIRLGDCKAALPPLERALAFWTEFDPAGASAIASDALLRECSRALPREPALALDPAPMSGSAAGNR